MSELRAVKDLVIGAVIQVDGFEDPLTVRGAKKIKKGLDVGKLEVTLVTPAGEKERLAMGPEEKVKIVRAKPAVDLDRSAAGEKPAKAGKGKGKGKVRAKAKPEPAAEPATAPALETRLPETPVPQPDAETSKQSRRQQQAAGEKKLSALDAAAKVLAETGTAMTCQELIQVMAEKNYWTSPGGKTPQATLYAAILREIQIKGDSARFRKSERGKFAARDSQ